ncbi:Papilin [Acipenser ruthenus]|uniref:Papilin n=1 Tax=Acipenser ruthenus TaxID=7906 RepID=A0A662YN43_ACIRT|nr:Papilin [Acipenser ruthenus]
MDMKPILHSDPVGMKPILHSDPVDMKPILHSDPVDMKPILHSDHVDMKPILHSDPVVAHWYRSGVMVRKVKRQGDYWAPWGEWGECSRTCGSGITTRSRQCYSSRTDGGTSCVGPTRNFRSCNIQDCSEGSRDFREEQCSQYDGTEFQGKRYKWLPYYGAPNKCELNCIPKGENFYFRHREAVVDGTPCEPGKRHPLGCDNMLESPQKEDQCLECGGDGRSCYPVKGTFEVADLPKGYNQMFIIPVGATSIRIREVVPTRNFLEASTLQLIRQEPNQGVEYEYYLPYRSQSQGYVWGYGSWAECSKECGAGYQSRLVFCTIDNEAYSDYLCASRPRPVSNRTCNLQPCPQTKRMAYLYQAQVWMRTEHLSSRVYSWKMGEWSACSATCDGGTQTRSVFCLTHDGAGSRVAEESQCAAFSARPHSQQACSLRQCAAWSARGWSECSETCGEGEQTRSVVCLSGAGIQLQDYACQALPKPASTQPCERATCPREISWHIGDWGLCSKSCDSGLRERQVICADRDRNFYNLNQCVARDRPSTVEKCNTQPCSVRQEVPSMPDPRGYDETRRGTLVPYIPDGPSTVYRNTERRESEAPPPPVNREEGSNPPQYHWESHGWVCTLSQYGCCPDGYTQARGPQGWGCPGSSCAQSRNTERRESEAPPPPVNREEGSNPPQYHWESHGWVCTLSQYGCCPDGYTQARGPQGWGCPGSSCAQSRYGCCPNGITAALGPDNAGCQRYYSDRESRPSANSNPNPNPSTDNTVGLHTQQADGSLIISELSSEDPGHYTCIASNARERDHRQLQLKVQGELKITTAPNNVQVSEGSSTQLPCIVTGSNVNVRWSRNGVPVRSDGRHVLISQDGSLILNNVQRVDEGSYTCNAYTGSHSVSASAEVRVIKNTPQAPPSRSSSAECIDQPELANCDLIVYAKLCSNEYYSSFCCASCSRHTEQG